MVKYPKNTLAKERHLLVQKYQGQRPSIPSHLTVHDSAPVKHAISAKNKPASIMTHEHGQPRTKKQTIQEKRPHPFEKLLSTERVYLSIISNGFTPLEDKKILTFTMPTDIKMKFVPFATPGFMHYAPTHSKKFRQSALVKIREMATLAKDTSFDDLNSLIHSLAFDVGTGWVSEAHPSVGTVTSDEEVHRITTVLPGSEMVNYEYKYLDNDYVEDGDEDDDESTEIYMIFPEDKTRPLNITRILFGVKKTKKVITLSDIVDFFKEKGVKEIVLLDFSSSFFLKKSKHKQKIIAPGTDMFDYLRSTLPKHHGGVTRKANKSKKHSQSQKRRHYSRKRNQHKSNRRHSN
jgi:hypothetical protein